MRIKSITVLFSIIASLIITQTGCSGDSAPEPVSKDNYYLDTICTISVYEIRNADGEAAAASDEAEAAESAIDKAFELCASLDKTLSRTQKASDVYRVNEAGGEWTEVSDSTIDLVRAGIEYAELSEGEFDITIGGVTELWDFHAEEDNAALPDADALAEAVKHVGYKNIEINGNMLRLADPEAKIDLGGIAKGYIGDRMAEVLEAEGVTSGIINLGGNVICIGGKDNASGDKEPDGNASGSDEAGREAAPTGNDEGAFVIGVEAPFSDRKEIIGKVNARDMTLVTSGVYERKIEVDGSIYHHILSTGTGYSVKTDLDAVTLITSKGRSVDADALSTICLIKGSDEAKKLIEKTDGVEAVFVLHDGTITMTDGARFEPVD